MNRIARAAGSIAGITLLSRVLGLLRDRLMAQALGTGWVQGTFLLAWTLPNLMRRLLGEGALSASLLPAYAKARDRDEDEARTLLERVLGTVMTLLLPLCALVVGGSLLLPTDWLPAPEEGGAAAITLLLTLNAILFFYALPICLAAVCTGALNTFGVFALPASIPVALNVIWIAALLLARPLGFELDVQIAIFTGACLAVGGFVQLAMVLVPLLRRGAIRRVRFGWPRRGTAAAGVFVAMAPTVLGMSLNQISSLLDQLLAYCLIAPGANMFVYLANRLLLFPHALTSMAVAVAVFPKLASEAGHESRVRMRRTLDQAAGATILVTLPAAAGLIMLAPDVIHVLFVGGRFVAADVMPTAWTTICLVAGLPFIGLTQLYARAFYAVADTATPARIAARLVLVNVAIGVTLLLLTDLGTAALTLASTFSALANAWWLSRGLQRHAPTDHSLVPVWLRSLAATLAMCAALPWLQVAGQDARMLERAFGDVLLPIVGGAIVYLVVHVLLRSPELRALRRRRDTR